MLQGDDVDCATRRDVSEGSPLVNCGPERPEGVHEPEPERGTPGPDASACGGLDRGGVELAPHADPLLEDCIERADLALDARAARFVERAEGRLQAGGGPAG